MNHLKINLLLVASLFIAVIFVPSIKSFAYPGHNNPVKEKRRLKNIPGTPKSLKRLLLFPEDFESYYNDHFELRYNLLDIYKYSKYAINDPAVKKVVFGTEPGWLFFNDIESNDVMGDYRNINQFTETELRKFVETLEERKQWLSEQGIEYMFVIAPSKHYVYPEYLPKKYYRIPQDNIKKQLAEALEQTPDINYLDLTEIIIEGKKEQNMFLKNDTHWTDYAANLSHFALSQKLEIIFPNLIKSTKKPWSEFTRPLKHIGDLAQINGTIDLFNDTRYLPVFDACAEKLMPPKKNTMDTFDTNCNKQLRTLVFRDSFFSKLQPFVSENFGLSRFVWQKMTFEAAKIHIKEVQPHIVIEEWIDRHLPEVNSAE